MRALITFGLAAALAAAGLIGCGGSDRREAGTATVLMLTAPDYLDPQLAYGTQSGEADWIAYTPLLTYRHGDAPDGTQLIPGLAESLPQISPTGRVYTLKLRSGLFYSDGQAVKAGDFPYTIERAIKLGWGGRGFFTSNIIGAREYETGQASSISGISTDDISGKITIRLIRPYAAFANVLAFPAAGLVPSGTPMRNLSNHPPAGVGAYRITGVVPNRSFNLVRNQRFAALKIPRIPTGNLARIVVRIEPNPRSAVEQVLSNRADNVDPGTTLPLALLSRFQSAAPARFKAEPIPSTLSFFMNTTVPPFNSELARRAVVTALNRRALARAAGGLLSPDCYLLPEGIPGHPGGSCPYGEASGDGNLEAGRQLVQASGTAGQTITVWGEKGEPEQAYVRYYARLLGRLGYRVGANLVPSSTYFRTVGAPAASPQTGFASWFNDFPNPIDFYRVMDADSVRATPGANLSRVQDPFIQQQLEKLNLVPAQELPAASGGWRALDEYVATKAYAAVFGSQEVPILVSDRIDLDSAVTHPLFLSDWSSWSLR